MFFRFTTADSPPQSPPTTSAHASLKSGLTFGGVAKTFLKFRRLENPESAEARDERESQCSPPPLADLPSVPPAVQTALNLPTPPSSPQHTRTSSEGSGSASPTSPLSPLASPASFFSSSPPRSPQQKRHHSESSSGQIPLSHPGIAEHACQRRESIERIDTYHCAGGVNVPVLLRTTRSDLMDIVSILGANALVEEQWKCTICGPRGRTKLTYKVQIRYKAQATRSTLADPHQPVALDQTRGIPGLMTVLRRNDD
ncbi:hypothetical protein AX14_004824 [Amanita brunnescens Koide BX004]|nr:hypothetical protein AX14_004824 [Amanita brunnescens Koide BX004]